MPRIIDRYVIREIVPPFLLALLVFTFILIIPFLIDLAEDLIAKGVPAGTILQLTVTLLPQALALTIPMALLIGLLVALGRLSADREFVVMMACGISPYRLLQPILVFSVICWGLTSWVMLKAMPDSNQRFREISTEIAMNRAEGEVRPRVFFEDFPNIVLYVREVPTNGQGWLGVLAADTSNPSAPVIFIAKSGRMIVDRQARTINMVLEEGTRHSTKLEDPSFYEVSKFERTIVSLNPESVFPRTGPARGERELSVEELQARAVELQAQGISPHRPIMEIHKKFSVPVACFVFAVLGLALGASNRKDGKLAAFVLGIAVIFGYYVIMFTAEALTKGFWVPAWLSMWIPNILLGAAGVFLLINRARSADQPIRIPVPKWLMRWRRDQDAVDSAPTTGPKRRHPRLVDRVPHFELPRPTLLDIYIAKQYLRILTMTTIGMLGLFYISTFIDMSDKLFKGQTSIGMIVEFLFWSTPEFLSYIIALAVLLSALVTVGLLTKNSELIVMRACGISLYRTALPMVAFALAGSVMLFGMEERVLATANQRADRLKHIIRTGQPQTFGVLNRKWIVGNDGQVYHYQYYDPRKRELNSLSVFEFDPQTHALKSRMFVNRATYDPDREPQGEIPKWALDRGWKREFDPKTQANPFTAFDHVGARFEAADYFVTEAREPELMNFGQLRRYITELKASGYNVLDHEVGLHRKIAFPFVTLVMTLIAVPFAVTTGRRGAMYGIGVGIVLALVYWTMISIFAAFGQGGLIDPALAAWAPNLIFGAAAVYLLLTVRT
ncbi:MAG TPA: LPS export ABC transporter permease LptF [Vicinamibacterales bacterium]|nr:LPS export ABC transporter permease LptF [Vicinamibacterales bacterium]